MEKVMPCPEECELSWRVHGCAEIIKAPKPDDSCWRCGGIGYILHDGDPLTPLTVAPNIMSNS